MTDSTQPYICDCPEPSARYAEGYAAGKDKAYFEIEMALQADTHAAGCGCRSCRVKLAALNMALLVSSSPAVMDYGPSVEKNK